MKTFQFNLNGEVVWVQAPSLYVFEKWLAAKKALAAVTVHAGHGCDSDFNTDPDNDPDNGVDELDYVPNQSMVDIFLSVDPFGDIMEVHGLTNIIVDEVFYAGFAYPRLSASDRDRAIDVVVDILETAKQEGRLAKQNLASEVVDTVLRVAAAR